MLRSSLALSLLLLGTPAFAQEPSGCDKFKWPLAHERSLLANPAHLSSGADLHDPFAATLLALAPLAAAKLPMPPSRAPKFAESYAGFLRLAAPPKAGIYRVTLSQPAWIDVVQDGKVLKSVAFTGAKDCAGLAKSVKFALSATPFIIEISSTSAKAIALVVTPD